MTTLRETWHSVLNADPHSFLGIVNSVATTGFTLSIIFYLIAYILIGRKFDKLFRHRTVLYDPHVPIISSMFRTGLYVQHLVIKHSWIRNPYFRDLYDGYNFRDNSACLEKVTSWIFSITWLIASCALFSLCLVSGLCFVAQLF